MVFNEFEPVFFVAFPPPRVWRMRVQMLRITTVTI
jgi:hypothetical protein